MARVTQSLATGMKILGGGNAPAYTLEYLTPTSKKPVGSYETIVIPYVEIGRDSKCAVRFGDDSSTVSRKHAAIERNKDGVWLINLSQSNPTLIHSQGQTKQVKERWFLNSGDVFQLSMEGPKLRFNTSSSGTAKMKFTHRMNLVVQQAIKPYRTYVVSLLAALVAITGVMGYFLFDLNKEVLAGKEELSNASNRIEKMKDIMVQDSIKRIEDRVADEERIEGLEEQLKKQRQAAAAQQRKLQAQLKKVEQSAAAGSADATSIDQSKIFYIEVTDFKINYEGKTESLDLAWSGTGFLLNDGRFVTARHVIQAWHFLDGSSKEMLAANVLEQLGGKVEVSFQAKSPDGTTINFKSTQFKWNDSGDVKKEAVLNGTTYACRVAELPDGNDWAYWNSGQKSNLPFNAASSKQLKQATAVVVFGYSYRIGSAGTPTPLFSSSVVGFDGTRDDVIYLTNRNFGQGNSGGPAFVKNGDQFEVIGIVSAGTGAEIGILVPIGNLQ